MSKLTDIKKQFKNTQLFEQAFTHRSWVNENPGKSENNERLEFLGDAILEFIVSLAIYNELPDKEEGYLTALRANLVNTQNLARVALTLNLGGELRLSKGEDDGGGRTNESLLADTVEALVGALFLDQGIAAATDFITQNILIDLAQKTAQPLKDAKSRLQELLQARGLAAPTYKVLSQTGPDHDKTFVVAVVSDNKELGKGEGKSKATAEQSAAAASLAALD